MSACLSYINYNDIILTVHFKAIIQKTLIYEFISIVKQNNIAAPWYPVQYTVVNLNSW